MLVILKPLVKYIKLSFLIILLAYADLNDELCLPCSSYSTGMSKCVDCSSDGTKVTCTTCSANYWFLSSDKSSCV